MKKALSLVLALVMCLGLTVPAFAESFTSAPGEPIDITLDGFLRTEYIDSGDGSFFAVLVVKDNSTVYLNRNDYSNQHPVLMNSYGYSPEDGVYWLDSGSIMQSESNSQITLTAAPDEYTAFNMVLVSGFGEQSYCWMCESNFARIAAQHKGVPSAGSEILGTPGPDKSTQPENPTDTPAYQVSNWAKDRVALAVETGLAADSLGNDYRVDITRAQFAATAVKLYEAMSGEKVPAVTENPFTDTTDSVILQAASMGFVSGVGNGKFDPNALVTREQACVMLSSVFTKLGGSIPTVEATTFADNANVAGWARNAVAFMNGKEIVTGIGDNNFNPKGNASIEQALLIALKMYENLK